MKQLLFVCLSVLLSHVLSAQKVALVLSGGGAKGLAHIGLIRALEENNIPIDYVCGTSMGAIVAGLYAAGYSPDQMEELFKSEKFKFWSTGKIQEEYRYYFNKPEESSEWLSFDLQKKDDKFKLQLPTNIIPEEQMDFAFMEMFSSTNALCNYDFNQLFVPFFCIATDVYNNKEVQLSSGDLGEAIRASMTFPFYFKPIEIDGALVFDGGLVNNFPAQNAMNTFKPDIIIGHKVANNASKPDEDDLMAQLENLMMQKTDYQIPPGKGILIESSFSNVGLLDFDQIDTIEAIGYKNTRQLMDSIKSRIHRRVPLGEIQEKRETFNRHKPVLEFQNVQAEGIDDGLQRKYIIQSIKHRDRTFSSDQLRENYFKLVSDPQIKSIRPIAIYNRKNGYFDLHLKVKQQTPLEINFGGNISTKANNQGYLGMNYRYFKNRAYTLSSNIYLGRFYNSVKIGGRVDFPSNLPVYLSTFLTFNRWNYYSNNAKFFFQDAMPATCITEDNNLRFELGVPVGTRAKLTFNSALTNRKNSYYLLTDIQEDDSQDQTAFRTFSSTISLDENTFNYKQFPTEGVCAYAGLSFIAGEENYSPGTATREAEMLNDQTHNHRYWQFRGLYDNYFKLSQQLSIGLYGEATYNNKKLFTNYQSTILSARAFSPTPFSKTLISPNFRANKFTAGGLKTIVNFNDQFQFRLEGYAFMPFRKMTTEDGMQVGIQKFDSSNLAIMGLGGLVYQTNFGPVSLTANYLENKNTRWFLVFSFGYVLFNKSAY
ncbi:patatin-like phospholipase family protein [Mangrovibacterium marinum]|uniref:NTE family protein n=1 Tax=Mangrovibacterium marinum TaxID=1639118 RepID=A0A2T5C0S5_9BACT|nr:patatin-like phospholipase family protein [Mangrovibacterium marinum]PTN08144.1 NTE family protein [Mangrovibacterium marinum]